MKVPSRSAASELYLRYGDPEITTSQQHAAAVWSNELAAVWHLGGLGDSTANGNLGTNAGSTVEAGKIAEGHRFDGPDDFVSVGNAASINDVFDGGGTVEAWFRATGWGESYFGRILDKGDDPNFGWR